MEAEMVEEEVASEDTLDTNDHIVAVSKQEVDGHSCEGDNPYRLAESACSAVLQHKADLVVVEAAAWVAAHGALRADDGSSCPGTSESCLDLFSHALPQWEP
jgi:hypothetical protein